LGKGLRWWRVSPTKHNGNGNGIAVASAALVEESKSEEVNADCSSMSPYSSTYAWHCGAISDVRAPRGKRALPAIGHDRVGDLNQPRSVQSPPTRL
jgi:hypothetical protein